MNQIWNNHNHSIISLAVMLVVLFNNILSVIVGFLLIGFWLGREHSQAEYRYIKDKKINRNELKFFDGFKLEAWNYDSFFKDLLYPSVVIIFCIILSYYLF